MRNIRKFSNGISNYRSKMLHISTPDGLGPPGQLTATRQLLPVLTACTYGQLDASEVFDGTLQSFAGGASGFSFFAGSCCKTRKSPFVSSF